MKHNYFFLPMDLQLFAEGGADGAGATGDSAAAAVPQNAQKAKNPLADVKYGIQSDADPMPPADTQTQNQPQQIDRNAEFEKLIKGEYKDLYDARVQDTLRRRLKNTQDTVDRYQALTPMLQTLAKKYGLSPDENGNYDAKALNDAIENDDSYFEAEAQAQGISVQQLKYMRKVEQENVELRKQMQQRHSQEEAHRIYGQWVQQAEQVKGVYPSFDLRTELENPKFAGLLKAGIDVRSAYEVIHKDEIIPSAMQFAAKTVEQKLANNVIANAQRPTENGNSAQAAATVKSDVSQLTKADRLECIRRARHGEKISF